VLKLTFCLRRKAGLSLPEFQEYWLNRHGPLVRRLQPALGMVRYVQVHRLDTGPVRFGVLDRRGRGVLVTLEPDAKGVEAFEFFEGGVDGVLVDAGHGFHGGFDAFAGADEQWGDEVGGGEARLGEHFAQARV